MSFTLPVTAEKFTKFAFVRCAMMFASVVFPTPGGPQKIMEGTASASIMRRSGRPGASSCACPTNSSSVSGRMRAASGRVSIRSALIPFLRKTRFAEVPSQSRPAHVRR